jgi:CxxC motif-containing protein
MLTSTVKVNSTLQRRLSVKTTDDIPKGLIFKAMEKINQIEAKVPVKTGDVLLKNILDTGVDIVSTMSIDQ